MSGKDDELTDFLLPQRWKKKRKRNVNFKIADESTLNKILKPARRQPEFQGKDYVSGIKTEDKQVFKCTEPNCNAYYTQEAALKGHMIKHVVDKGIMCQFCEIRFKTIEDKVKHLDELHPDLEKNPDANPLQCKKCGKISRDKKALWRHCRETHRDQSFPCPHCNFPFTNPDNLKVHLRNKHLPEDVPVHKWRCDTCGKTYAHKNNLATHIRTNHRGEGDEGGTFRCVLCDVKYDNKTSYRRHMKRHVNPKFYPCKICNVKFQDLAHYKRHIASLRHKKVAQSLGVENHEMEETETKVDTSSLQLAPEVDTDGKKNPTPLTEEELIASCKAKVIKIILHRVDSTTIQKPLHRHSHATASKRRKASGLYLNCIYCDRSFPNLEATKVHEATCFMKISNKKLYICPLCNKEFKSSHKLDRHSMSHTDSRPYQCSYCDAKLKSLVTKIQHEKAVHFGLRPRAKDTRVFRCEHEECQDKQYTTSKSLKRHVESVHLGIRYRCKTCGKLFRGARHLRKHDKEFHAENPTLLPCRACKKTYTSKAALLSHFKTMRHHRKTEELGNQFGNKEEKMQD